MTVTLTSAGATDTHHRTVGAGAGDPARWCGGRAPGQADRARRSLHPGPRRPARALPRLGRIVGALGVAAAVGGACLSACAYDAGPTQAAPNEPGRTPGHHAEDCMTAAAAGDEDIFDYKGHRLKIVGGDVFRCAGRTWQDEGTMTADWFKDFRFERGSDGCFLRHVRSKTPVPMVTHFSSGFESDDFFELFGADRWSHFTVLSPRADTIDKYVGLRRNMLATRKTQFLDNRIDIETVNTRSGKRALRFYAARPAPHMVTSKSFIEKDNLCFGKGDDVWISAWLFIEAGMPATLIDIETPMLKETPGIRIIIVENNRAAVELKWLKKIQYRQEIAAIPVQRWFQLKLHLRLSNRDDGLVELWQDGVEIISASGQTLPTHDSVYWMLEYGITATPRDTVVLADDLVISDRPL